MDGFHGCTTLAGLMPLHARERPTAIAMRFGDRTTTYADLDAHAAYIETESARADVMRADAKAQEESARANARQTCAANFGKTPHGDIHAVAVADVPAHDILCAGLADEELYCRDAAWCGLYDRMHTHTPDEIDRRLALAADYGELLSV